MEPHFMQFILRTEAMTVADRRLADEQLGRMAQALWLFRRAAVERWRRLTGRQGSGGSAGQAVDSRDRTRVSRRGSNRLQVRECERTDSDRMSCYTSQP